MTVVGTFAKWPVELTASVLGGKADSQSTSRRHANVLLDSRGLPRWMLTDRG